MGKPITPYQRLLNRIRDWVFDARYRRRVEMWYYPKARIEEGWSLSELAHRVQAAEQLGYEVLLEWRDDEEPGLRVMYRKKLPAIPVDWR